MENVADLRALADPWMTSAFGPFWYGFFLFGLGVTIIGYIIGFSREQRHYYALHVREKHLKGVFTSNSKTCPPGASDSALVTAHVALATDGFRVLSITFRRLFGGRVRRYEKINDRARREAMIRLKQATLATGRNAIYNVRIQSSQITASGRGGSAAIEILAWGTAMKVEAGVN